MQGIVLKIRINGYPTSLTEKGLLRKVKTSNFLLEYIKKRNHNYLAFFKDRNQITYQNLSPLTKVPLDIEIFCTILESIKVFQESKLVSS